MRRSFLQRHQQKNGSMSLVILVLLFWILASVLVTGYFYMKAKQTASTPIEQPKFPIEANKQPVRSDWQVYTNSQYGYSIMYPPNFQVRSDSSTDDSSVRIYSPTTFKTLEMWIYNAGPTEDLNVFVENEIDNLNKVNAASTVWVPLKIIGQSSLNGQKAIFVSNNANSQALDLRVYVKTPKQNIMHFRLGPVFEGEQENYKQFFYDEISTVSFQR